MLIQRLGHLVFRSVWRFQKFGKRPTSQHSTSTTSPQATHIGPQTIHWFPDYYIATQTAVLVPTPFSALDKQDCVMEVSSRHCASNLQSLSMMHFASVVVHYRIPFPAWFRATWFIFATLLDPFSPVISVNFWMFRTVSACLLYFCWHSYFSVRLLAKDQVRKFIFKIEKTFSAGIYDVSSIQVVRRCRIRAICELAYLLCHNAAYSSFEPWQRPIGASLHHLISLFFCMM